MALLLRTYNTPRGGGFLLAVRGGGHAEQKVEEERRRDARWSPDGQLCPTVPNKSNYIHWMEDLLASNLISGTWADGKVNGFDLELEQIAFFPFLVLPFLVGSLLVQMLLM
ncbi:uncharacterized protein [Primulina huaijiensis]|uniref:uncharacterized protein n=1 Tax=Primulina huaijiensis TaxID=1492673 RepID=UPI003CC74243